MTNYVRESVNDLKTKIETKQDALQDISLTFVFGESLYLLLQKEQIPAEHTIKHINYNNMSNVTKDIQPTGDQKRKVKFAYQKCELKLVHSVLLKKM